MGDRVSAVLHLVGPSRFTSERPCEIWLCQFQRIQEPPVEEVAFHADVRCLFTKRTEGPKLVLDGPRKIVQCTPQVNVVRVHVDIHLLRLVIAQSGCPYRWGNVEHRLSICAHDVHPPCETLLEMALRSKSQRGDSVQGNIQSHNSALWKCASFLKGSISTSSV
jgi:hypothetical protein